MALATIPYKATIHHDGRVYTVEIQSLEVPQCSNCHTVSFDSAANEAVDLAFRRQEKLLTPEEIRQGREQLGLKQQELADQLAISVSTLSRWETGAQVQQRSLNRAMKVFFRSQTVRWHYARIQEEEDGVAPPPQSRETHIAVSLPSMDMEALLTATNTEAKSATPLGRSTAADTGTAEEAVFILPFSGPPLSSAETSLPTGNRIASAGS
jgi:DNA-binding transcriptional regulator YiaG